MDTPLVGVHEARDRSGKPPNWTSKTRKNQIHITLVRGARVIVHGRLKQRTFETREGEKRTVIELDVDEIGPSLRYATATVTKVNRATNGGFGGGQASSPADPWTQGVPVAA
jgi:single-stranded DNA-binding protein